MNRRLEQLMKAENLTSAKLAEILSVQPSSISHLLSGRNKPNFDFIAKLLVMFPQLNPRWIINGQGSMYMDDNHSKTASNDLDVEICNPPVEHTDMTAKSLTNSLQVSEYEENNTITNIKQNTLFDVQVEDQQLDTVDEVDEKQFAEPNSNTVKPLNNSHSAPSNNRNVERVLLLYNDNTFEFFSNSNN